MLGNFSRPSLCAAAIVMALSQPALSASLMGALNVGLTLEDGSCELKSVPSFDFGTYANLVFNAGRKPIKLKADIVINCTASARYELKIGAGLHDETQEFRRVMHNDVNDRIWYHLMFDREDIEDHPLDANDYAITRGEGTGTDESIAVVAEIPQNMASPIPAPGVYSDTVTLILAF